MKQTRFRINRPAESSRQGKRAKDAARNVDEIIAAVIAQSPASLAKRAAAARRTRVR